MLHVTLSLSRITTKIVCYSLIWTSTVDRRTHKQQRTFANIRLWKHCFPAFHKSFKYSSESSTAAKVKGHESCLWSVRSTGANVPRNESSTGAKVLYGLFAPGNKSAEERKGQIPYLYSALFVVPHTQGTQAWITQCYLQLHQCLPLPRKRSPDGASPD